MASHCLRWYSIAISEASLALFMTSAMLDSRLSPPVRSLTLARRKGVTSLPRTPADAASASAWSMAAFMTGAGISYSTGMGLAMTAPPESPRSHLVLSMAAIAATESMRSSARRPERLV